ncbi:MAG: hypothetical protein CL568_09415 [Alphaproteobacteria bacterium]|jgi:drug/metabolite transporter (DMT)-like permease|nr:hypothetical protein [Alphaproteobacteria bacterium]PPR13921.1 MAG: hypothetical protein CFH42_00786 [Alphaproteobacteria bacterium MarineAlpha12_Bin1]|tara:strand:+ start:1318 stop:2235 length:918 start_codon:yes stop_codon:yes gene_type:complete
MNLKVSVKSSTLGFIAGIFALITTVAMLLAGRIGATGDVLTIWDLAGIRHGIAAILAIPLIIYSKPWHMKLSQYLVSSIFGGAPFVLLLFGGMVYAPVSHAGIFMNGTLPLAATVIAWFWLKEKPNSWQALGIIIILVGMSLVIWQAVPEIRSDYWIGHLLFVASGIWFSVWYVSIRAWKLTVIQTLCSLLVFNAVFYTPIWLIFLPSGLSTAPIKDITLQVIVHGVFGAFLAVFGHAYAARTIGPMKQSAIMAGAPILALIISVPLLGEVATSLDVTGAIIVTFGILLVVGIRLNYPNFCTKNK